MQILILSDVHGNLSALQNVLVYAEKSCSIDAVIALGDLIDYGMHSNEVAAIMKNLPYPMVCNILGNHEYAIIHEDYTRFSSKRGKLSAIYTHSALLPETWDYIISAMSRSGMCEFQLHEKHCLAVHGSLNDIYWKSIQTGQDFSAYRGYDYVFSGHSHIPHYFEEFYAADDLAHRNKKKTVFINPGSVGQPRNLNPMAQFAVLDSETGEVWMKRVPYDIKKEQKSFAGQVDDFYRVRLESGI